MPIVCKRYKLKAVLKYGIKADMGRNMDNEALTIGRLAAAAEVNVETVRYYQRLKLMPVPKKALGGIRRYGAPELSRLQFIKTAQSLGFTLAEVGELIELDDGTGCSAARAIAQHKLRAVRLRLGQLKRIEKVLAQLVSRCETRRGAIRCPLIDSLSANAKTR